MKNFNHANDYIIQYLFENYLINQSAFSAISGNKQYFDQARNFAIYPLTFCDYCKNVYFPSRKNFNSGVKTFNNDLNFVSRKILKNYCTDSEKEDEIFKQIKDVSAVYSSAINCYNNLYGKSDDSQFSSTVYEQFVDDIVEDDVAFNDKGWEANKNLYGVNFCKEALDLLKSPMEEAEKYLQNQSYQSVSSNNYCEDSAQ